MPGTATPGDTTPGDTTPGDTTPGDTTPGDRPLGDTSPGDSTPGDGTPGDSTPGDATPGDGASSDGPAPTGTQPDGSWIGREHGSEFTLTPEQNAAADRFLAGARADEGQISPQVTAVAAHIDGARMQGYPDFVLKGEDSLKRKLATDLAENPDLSLDEAITGLRDSVRYTIEVPPTDYADGVVRAVDDLRARGYENVTWKPTWDNPDTYKGVNSTWRVPATGRVFEVQFHTPDSFAAKMATHELYEAQRVPGVPAEEVARLRAEQGEIFRQVDVPPGAERLTALGDDLARDRQPVAVDGGHGNGPDAPSGGASDTPGNGRDDAGAVAGDNPGSRQVQPNPHTDPPADTMPEDSPQGRDDDRGPSQSDVGTPLADAESGRLVAEAQSEGLNLSPDRVIEIGKDPTGRFIWLEEGGVNPRTGKEAGLQHIANEHGDDFARQGVAHEDMLNSFTRRQRAVSTPGGFKDAPQVDRSSLWSTMARRSTSPCPSARTGTSWAPTP